MKRSPATSLRLYLNPHEAATQWSAPPDIGFVEAAAGELATATSHTAWPALAALKEFASLTPDSTVMTIVTEGMLVS